MSVEGTRSGSDYRPGDDGGSVVAGGGSTGSAGSTGASAVPGGAAHGADGGTRVTERTTHVRSHGGGGGGDEINVNVPGQRGDQVRWGPVWAGLIVALPTFLLGTLIFLALGVLDNGGDNVTGTTAGIVTGLIALGAFFLGGLTAAATAMWRGLETGLLHGILVWALSIVAILTLTLLGGGAILGSAGNIASQLVSPTAVTNAASGAEVPQVSEADQQQAREAGKSAASYGVLGLGLTFLASAAGGLVGAKFWPRKKDSDDMTTQVRH